MSRPISSDQYTVVINEHGHEQAKDEDGTYVCMSCMCRHTNHGTGSYCIDCQEEVLIECRAMSE